MEDVAGIYRAKLCGLCGGLLRNRVGEGDERRRGALENAGKLKGAKELKNTG